MKFRMALSKIKIFLLRHFRLYGSHQFVDRSQSKSKLCLIIAGHKPFIWPITYKRLLAHIEDDYDVVVVTPGGQIPDIVVDCEEAGWSYLSTNRNNICLAQNLAIHKHPNADLICKVDEDMLITSEMFPSLMTTYDFAKNNLRYHTGLIVPLININGYGYLRILEKFNLVDSFEHKFGKAYYTAGSNDSNDFTKNPMVARHLWSEYEQTSRIDKMSKKFFEEPFQYSICPIRFSIGVVLFERNLWSEMNYFNVGLGNGVSIDEIQICSFCNTNSKVIVVAENCLVGHLSYGPQTSGVIDLISDKPKLFSL